MRGRLEEGILGSEDHVLADGRRRWVLPVRMPTLMRARIDPWEVETRVCEVERGGREPVTCHACEGGHHVHVWWAGRAAQEVAGEEGERA